MSNDNNQVCPTLAIDTFIRRDDKLRRTDKEEQCLKAFDSTLYEMQKNTNPPREPQTCLWFLENPKFLSWRDESTSCLLWVTADPGCGKSVLSRALVDEHLLGADSDNTTSCYFFFKDTSDDQRSATSALAALLHQLFSSDYGAGLIRYALPEFNKHKEISSEFEAMWRIIEKIAMDPDSSKIVFLLDALDECEATGRITLIKKLADLERRRTSCPSTTINLKVLVTSRPYWEIEQDFTELIKDIPSIELKGDKESKSIQQEIDLVARAEIERLPNEIFVPHEVKHQLLDLILGMDNRTYLWLHLTLALIKAEMRIDASMISSFSLMHDTLAKTYTAILDRSRKPEITRRLLHIVAGAYRPLTLTEVEAMLFIREGMRSQNDLMLQGENQFKTTVRNLCGLFVRVVDNKIYLIHQTAKEYLIRAAKDLTPSRKAWRHSFESGESHFTIATICLQYLLFSEFESDPLVIEDEVTEAWPMEVFDRRRRKADQYSANYYILQYAARYWHIHFREAKPELMLALVEAALEVCDVKSKRCKTWLQVYWTNPVGSEIGNHFFQIPKGISTLMIACLFGHEVIVQKLINNGTNVNCIGGRGEAALTFAALGGHLAVVQQLIKAGAIVNSDKYNDNTPLVYACFGRDEAVIQELLNAGARLNGIEFKNLEIDIGYFLIAEAYPEVTERSLKSFLEYTIESRREDILENFIDAGLDINAHLFSEGVTLLHLAAIVGELLIMQLLVDNGAQIDVRDDEDKTPLFDAVYTGSRDIVQLLLKSGADPNARDDNGQTPLHAATTGCRDVVQLLFDYGADPNARDDKGRTPLHAAATGCRDVVQLLLDYGAEIEVIDDGGCTPLHTVARQSREQIANAQLLLEHRARVSARDREGCTPLNIAAAYGRTELSQLLLKYGAFVDACNNSGETPLIVAAKCGNRDIVQLLREHGASIEFTDKRGMTHSTVPAINDLSS